MSLNLATVLHEAASARPEAVALRTAGRDDALTYAALWSRVGAFAATLEAAGVRPGDRVGLMAPNVPEFVVAYWAILRAGAAVVPMNPLLKTREVAYYLRDSGATAFAYAAGLGEHAAAGAAEAGLAVTFALDAAVGTGGAAGPDVARRDPGDAAVLLYTSGTTGEPKGAVLTHSNMLWNAVICAHDLVGTRPEDRTIATLPLFHSFGQTVAMNATFRGGGELILVPRFDPVLVRSLIDGGANVFLGVPTMYSALLNLPPDAADAPAPRLRACLAGGAPLPVEVLRGFEARYGCPVLEGYGLSETSPVASFNSADARKPGSIGRPIWGVQLRVVDAAGAVLPSGEVGEIQIRGHNVMREYLGRPDATAAAIDAGGWFATGDLAYQDEDGFFFIVDRAKDLILRGGMNVYPREVEEVLYEHPDVAEAAVVGMPHPELGEDVLAVVALIPGATATEDVLRDFVKERIAAYKYPRRVVFVDALPKGATGKILKRELDVAALVPEQIDV